MPGQYPALADLKGRRRTAIDAVPAGWTTGGEDVGAAQRRSDIDFQARTVRIPRQLSEQRGGGFA
jgi:hypothetical protein